MSIINNQGGGSGGGSFHTVPPPITGSYLNQSNIGYNVNKLLTMPDGVFEVDGYKETWEADDTHAVRVFDVLWSRRQAFVNWVLGYSNTILLPDQEAPFLSRTPPQQHPERYWLYATRIEMLQGLGAIFNNPSVVACDNFGNPILDADGDPQFVPMICYVDTSTNTDGRARYAVHYNVLQHEIRTDAELAAMNSAAGEMERYVVRDFKFSLSTLPLPKQLTFAEGPQAGVQIPANAAYIFLPMQELHYTWMYVPDPPYEAISACVGRVNSGPFDGAQGWPTRAPGTCLMQAPVIERHRTPLGRVCWNINYTFLYRPKGWSKFPATDGQFYLATYNGQLNGDTWVNSADFSQLFQVPEPVTYQ